MRVPGAGRGKPSRRVDVLDAGHDGVPLRERWRGLPRAVRALLVLALAGAAVAAGAWYADRRHAERERAAALAVVDLEARLLAAPVPGQRPARLDFLLEVRNRGELPVTAERWLVAVEGYGLLDATLDGGVLPPDAAARVPVPWGFPHCRRRDAPAPADLSGVELVGRVRPGDGVPRDVRLPLPGVSPAELLDAVQCPEQDPRRTAVSDR